MSTSHTDPSSSRQDKLLATLERLLAIEATELKGALTEASDLVVEALGAEKVDAFMHDPSIDTLVAVGVSRTPLGEKQRQVGLDRLPVANGGHTVGVFQTGDSYLTGHADEDSGELPGVIRVLGVRSGMVVPLEIEGVRRGVLDVTSTQPEVFTQDDLRFLEAAARWVGLVAHRAQLVERITEDAAESARRGVAEQLVTVLAHDLNNHLTPLKARLDMLRVRFRKDQRPRDLQDAEAASAALARVRRLIDDLLDLGRLEQGILGLSIQPVNLAALARETADLLRSRNHEIRVEGPDELVAEVDPDRARQVLENVVSNAVRHSPARLPVAVELREETRQDGRWAVITVRDQGPGVPPELMPRLFTRFTAGPDSSGLGLGLYLSRSIAEAHGGELTVDSNPGMGASFHLSLPVRSPLMQP